MATKKKAPARKKRAPRPNMFKTACEAFGLSQVQLGEFLGVSPRTSRRWVREVPDAVMMLLAIMREFEVTPEQALKLAKLKR